VTEMMHSETAPQAPNAPAGALNEQVPTLSIDEASDLIGAVQREVNKAVIGQADVIEQILLALVAAGHVLVEGVPGLGKTLLARSLAKAFDGQFSRIQFTPDLMPTDITGHVIYDLKREAFNLHKGPVFTHLLLADEINRAPAKTQAALLEVMQERQVSIEGRPLAVPTPFMAIATQNPIEQEGTYPLPEAQVDRFLLKILIDYPSADEEVALVNAVTDRSVGDVLDVSVVRSVISAAQVLALQQTAATVRIDAAVTEYGVRIVRATREWSGIRFGAGPRGAIALVRAARAFALMNGRDFVVPDDLKTVAIPVLRHRVIVEPEMELEGHTPDDLLGVLLEHTDAPRT
jgi:MoxR-like ATPase